MINERNAGRKKGLGLNYRKTYWTDSKTHASISKIIEMRKLNKITAESLDRCLEEALKSKE